VAIDTNPKRGIAATGSRAPKKILPRHFRPERARGAFVRCGIFLVENDWL